MVKASDAGGVDSGYASTNTSQSSTPDSSKGAFVDGGAVVRKTRLSWGIPFDKPIPILTQNRFKDLLEFQLTRILMSLKVLGESETTAAPWVFIQCNRATFLQAT